MFKVRQANHIGFMEDVEWSEDDKPLTFETEEDAWAEIKDHVSSCKWAVAEGNMEDSPEIEDFDVVKV